MASSKGKDLPFPRLTLNELAARLLSYIDNKRTASGCGHKSAGIRFSVAKLARDSGITYRAACSYIIYRDRRMSLDVCDALMYGLGIGVLDLVQPHDLVAVFDSFDRQVQYTVRRDGNNGKYQRVKPEPPSGESPSTPSTPK